MLIGFTQNGTLQAAPQGQIRQDPGSIQDSGDPVNVATGELQVDDTDLSLPGPLPLDLRRNYSSIDAGSSANNLLGYGWKLSFMPYLQQNADGSLLAAQPDGSTIAFTASNSTFFTVQAAANPYLNTYDDGDISSTRNWFNANITLTGNAGDSTGIYTLHRPDGGSVTYQVKSFPLSSNLTRQRPYLTQWMDAQGNYLTFSYDNNATLPNSSVPNPAFGQLARIVSSNGNYLVFEYDAFGHLTDAFARDGRHVHYDFDSSTGDLIGVTRPDGSQVIYSYAASQPGASATLVNSTNAYHLITEIDEPEGRRLLNYYDASRRVIGQQALAGPNGTLVPVANYTYASLVNPVVQGIHSNTFTTTYLAPNTGNITYKYYHGTTSAGVLTDSLLAKVTDANNNSINYTWFVSANSSNTTLVSSTPAPSSYTNGNSTVAGYYQRSLQSKTDQRGLKTAYAYDSQGAIWSLKR